MSIYENVKKACRENAISISELEDTLGFARSSIYKWDKHKPSAEKLKAVAKKLNKPMEYFLDETEEVK